MTRAVCLLAALGCSLAHATEVLRIAMPPPGPEIVLSGPDLLIGPDEETGDFKPVSPSHTATVRIKDEGLEVNGAKWSSAVVRFRAGGPKLKAGAVTVRGEVVVKNSGRRLLVVNVLPLEDYLAGVLGAEMPVSFPAEALKAQAVAARTYALRRKMEMYGSDFHLGSGVLSQVYKGLKEEDPRTHAAVEATRGQVLTFELQPIEAYFHASCGGRTESGKNALGRDLPYLQPVDCPCHELPTSHWKLSLHASEIRQRLGRVNTSKLEVLARTPSGRAEQVRLDADHVVDAVTFREKIGYSRVKSLWFEVRRQGTGEVILEGRGFGHGAGLCQWGAKLWAIRGWDYRRILAHYYPGTELQVLY